MSFLREFFEKRPRLASWIVLAIGMVILLLWSSKDVEFLPTQRIALVIATILLAGACVWIIYLED